MRQRRLKGLDEKLEAYKNRLIIEQTKVRGRWQELFSEEQPLYLELGCGKAQFILQLAEAYPERNFIGLEGNRSVMLRALQKSERVRGDAGLEYPGRRYAEAGSDYAAEMLPNNSEHASSASESVWYVAPNLIFVNLYLHSVSRCFAANELDGMYLNFSDPWPKERHAARRLTHESYLKGYGEALKPGSILEFKTDNEGLFRFSVKQFAEYGLERLVYTEDLHNTELESAKFMTEYEERFSLRGNPIYYTKVKYPET